MSEIKYIRTLEKVAIFDCGHKMILTSTARLEIGDSYPCPTCAEIKAAEDKRGEEVLKMGCGIECEYCKQRFPIIFKQGSWLHHVNDAIIACKCQTFRQAYKKRYGQG